MGETVFKSLSAKKDLVIIVLTSAVLLSNVCSKDIAQDSGDEDRLRFPSYWHDINNEEGQKHLTVSIICVLTLPLDRCCSCLSSVTEDENRTRLMVTVICLAGTHI